MPSPAVTILPYGDTLTRFGIVVDRGYPVETVIFVPGARWRDQRWLFVAIAAGFTMLAWFVIAISAGTRGFVPLVVICSSVGILGVAFGGVFNTAVPSVRRKMEFRVSPTELTVIVTGPKTDDFPGYLERRWPLEQVGRIKGDLYGMGLTIQIVGHDLLEFLHGHAPALRVALAELLNETVSAYRPPPCV